MVSEPLSSPPILQVPPPVDRGPPAPAGGTDEGTPPSSAGPDSVRVGVGAGSNVSSGKRWWVYTAIVVVVVVGAVVASYAVLEMNHKSTSSSGGTVLVPAGTLYSLPPDQYDAVIFAQKSPATVEGTITNVGGVQLYVMSPQQYLVLVNTYNVTGYEWTSGALPSDTYYHLDITIPVGSWDLVFSNSVPGNTTAIGIYSNLVENP